MGNDAFICYSHRLDQPLALALRHAVQALGKPWWHRRAATVFLDQASLSATPALWPELEKELAASRWLILIASPEAAASEGVAREVTWWLEHRSADTILIALAAGDLAWSGAAHDFEPGANHPLPAKLKGAFSAEPGWVNVRRFRELPAAKSRKDNDFLTAAAKFAARIRGIRQEDLLSEEVRQQRRARTLAVSAAVALSVLAALAATMTVQRQRALTEARDNLASALVGRAALATSEKRGHQSLVYLAEAERASPGGTWPVRSIPIGAPVATREAIFHASGPVREVRFHPGRSLLAAHTSEGIELIDLTRAAPTFTLRHRNATSRLESMVFGPGGESVLARDGNSVLQWPLDGGSADAGVERARGRDLESISEGIDVTDDGLVFAPGSGNQVLRLSGPSLSNVEGVASTGDAVNVVAAHPSGRWVAVGSINFPTVNVYRVGGGAPPIALEHPSSGAHLWTPAVAFSPDGRYLVAAQGRGLVRIWSVSPAAAAFETEVRADLRVSESKVTALAVSPDARLFATADEDLVVTVAELETGRPIARMSGHRGAVRSVAFSPDGRFVASGSEDGTVQVWRLVPENDLDVRLDLGGSNRAGQSPCSLALSPDGSKLAMAGDEGALWAHATEPLSPDGARRWQAMTILGREATGDMSRAAPVDARVYDLANHLPIGLEEGSGAISCVQFAAGGRYLVGVAPDERRLLVWSMPGGELVSQRAYDGGSPSLIGADLDGRRIAVALEDGTVELGALDGGTYVPERQLPATAPGSGPPGLQWRELVVAERGDLVMAMGGRRSALWRLPAGTEHELTRNAGDDIEIAGHAGDLGAVVLKDHDRLAIALTRERGGLVELALELPNARGGVASSAGRYLAVARADGAVAVWDTVHSKVARWLVRDVGRLVPLCFDRTGTVLVAKVYWDPDDEKFDLRSGFLELWDVVAARPIGQLPLRNLAGGSPFSLSGARLGAGAPRLMAWGDKTVVVKSGVAEAMLGEAETASGFALKGGILERLPPDDPRERALEARPVKVDLALAELWRLVWKMQRDLQGGAKLEPAGAGLRGWLARNPTHPYRFQLQAIVEGVLER